MRTTYTREIYWNYKKHYKRSESEGSIIILEKETLHGESRRKPVSIKVDFYAEKNGENVLPRTALQEMICELQLRERRNSVYFHVGGGQPYKSSNVSNELFTVHARVQKTRRRLDTTVYSCPSLSVVTTLPHHKAMWVSILYSRSSKTCCLLDAILQFV